MFRKQLSSEEIETKKSTLTAALVEAQRLLQDGESALATALIDGDESGVKGVADLRARADGYRLALAELEKQRPAAVQSEKRRALDGLRAELEAKRLELATISKKTAPLLKALSLLEGVDYEPGILRCQRLGEWYSEGLRSPEPWEGAFADCAPAPGNRECLAIPASKRLRMAIEEVQAKIAAADLELATPAPATAPQVPGEPEYTTTTVPAVQRKDVSNRSYRNSASPSERASDGSGAR
jgi:hypothetical protein